MSQNTPLQSCPAHARGSVAPGLGLPAVFLLVLSCSIQDPSLSKPKRGAAPSLHESWSWLNLVGCARDEPVLAKGDFETLRYTGLCTGVWTYYYPDGSVRAIASYGAGSWFVDVVLYRLDGSKAAAGRLRAGFRAILTHYYPVGSWVLWDADGKHFEALFGEDGKRLQ